MLTLAKELGIGDRVEHLQPVHIEKVKDVMADADVGITTHQSGDFADLYFSTKIVEFMTQGLPVISSRTGTIEKYIPEDAIFYFEPLQVEDLVRQILTMYYNPGLVLDKIINSKKVVSKLDWREEESRLVSLYGELVSEKKSVKPNRSK
jgi:glycosyltransferase involved in cell wall biosynthesis